MGKVGRFVDPMTYVFKGAGMGLTKIGDVMAGFKGLGTFEVPALPEGVVTLPEGGFKLADGTLHLPEGSAIPDSAFEVPSNSFKLPDGTEIPAGAIDLGDGVVRLPEGMAPPAGSLRIPEGALKLPEGTAALPESATRLTDLDGSTVYVDGPGNVLKEDGTLKQHHTAARQETPVSGAATPPARPPAEQPALVGAHTVSNTDSTIRMGDDLGGVGRAGDDLGGGGSRGSDGTNRTPGGSAGDRMPSNSLGGESSSNHTSGNERPPANNPAEGGGSAARQESSSAGDSSYPNASSRSTGGNRLPQAGSPRGSELDGVAHRGDDSAAEHPDSLDQGDAPKPDDDNAVQHGDAPATNPRGGNEPDYSRPAILPADGPLTLRTVRNTSHTRTRWERGEEFHRQMWGGGAERHYPVPTSTGSRYPVTASGGRKVDVPIDMPDGRTVAMEVKTYGPFRTITLKNGTSQTIPNEVPLSKHIREQIHKDIALRRMDPGYDPRWSFTHAGPSDALRAYLKKARIIFLEYGKPPRKN
ncbi:hypothetical protein [Streptomyces sp. NPDC048669]|uniref:hypothetical protein n=1 Tax=Streptomyces sp. NPDC048669 TaxID=3155267 RepID=UPI0034324EEA